jgi:hypothetical protein
MAETIRQRECRGCKTPIVQVGLGRDKVWCSRKCGRTNNYGEPKHSRIYFKDCFECGSLFVSPRDLGKRCNDKACLKAYNRRRAIAYQQKWKQEHGVSYASEWRKRNPERARANSTCYTIGCEICGNEYKSSKPGARYCVGECTRVAQSLANGGKGAQRYRGSRGREPWARYTARIRLQKAAKGHRGSGTWTQGPCHQCGTPFLCPPRGTPARYCSPSCTRKASRQRRKYRERSAPGSPVSTTARWEVLRDDNFTCWICEQPLNLDARPEEIDAPTIDHVIALAAGGTHERSNLRAAHRYCNAVKSASKWP